MTTQQTQALIDQLEAEFARNPVYQARFVRVLRESFGCWQSSYTFDFGRHYPDLLYPGVCDGRIQYTATWVAEPYEPGPRIGPIYQPRYYKSESCCCTECGQEFPVEDFQEQIDAALLEMDTLAAQAAVPEEK